MQCRGFIFCNLIYVYIDLHTVIPHQVKTIHFNATHSYEHSLLDAMRGYGVPGRRVAGILAQWVYLLSTV